MCWSTAPQVWGEEKKVCGEGVPQFLVVWVMFCGKSLLGLWAEALNMTQVLKPEVNSD